MRKSLLEEVQELEARAVDPGAAVLRDASGRRYIQYTAKHHKSSSATCFYLCQQSDYSVDLHCIYFSCTVPTVD